MTHLNPVAWFLRLVVRAIVYTGVWRFIHHVPLLLVGVLMMLAGGFLLRSALRS